MNIEIELKSKHFYLIASILLKDAGAKWFATLNKIKDATAGKNDDDLVIVETTKDILVEVYRGIANLPEGSFTNINNEMLSILQPQIVTGVANGVQEWIDAASELSAIRTENLSRADVLIGWAKTQLQ